MAIVYNVLIRLVGAAVVVSNVLRKLTIIGQVDVQITIVKSLCITMCAAILGSIVLK